MGWEILTYSCGHTERKQLFGKMSERQRKVDSAQRYDCPQCRAKAVQAAAEVAGLPKLEGSDKQVAWASELRAALLDAAKSEREQAERYLARIASRDFPADTPEEKVQAAERECRENLEALETLRGITRAAWWIDHRFDSIRQVMAELAKREGTS
jgi:hypothetical protein